MALSAKQAETRDLVNFCRHAEAMGARVSEMPPWDEPNTGVHSPKSFHYDKDGKYGQAADINYGRPGTSASEREMLTYLSVVAESFGLGVIYARYGTVGSAAQHTAHLHVDVGSWTNLGKGPRKPTPGDSVVWDTQPAIHAARDNLAGNETKRRLNALREASNRGGVDFPHGVKYAQDVVGTKEDGKWGPLSRLAHDETVRGVQKVWKSAGLYTGELDGIWGPLMDAAWRKFIDRYGR